MPDPRNVDFLRQYARTDQRVSNMETGVHPTKGEVAYEDVGAPVSGGDVDLTGYLHYNSRGGQNDGNSVNINTAQYFAVDAAGATFFGYGSLFTAAATVPTVLAAETRGGTGKTALLAQALDAGGNALRAYTVNGIAVDAQADAGTAVRVNAGTGATALEIVQSRIFGGSVIVTVDDGGVTVDGGLNITSGGLNITSGGLNVTGSITVVGDVNITGNLYLNGVPVTP